MKNAARTKRSVAAFFDLDGTLVPGPSLERRFFRLLRYRRALRVQNYLWWMGEALRLAPRGIAAIQQANKMYLRGLRVGEGQSGMCVPPFLPCAMERVVWHAKQEHAIVVVSGSLEPLARAAAIGMETELEARGIVAEIRVCATQLENHEGKWTGCVIGEAMYGEAKERAVRCMAAEMDLDLPRCFAYGDSSNDRWMLAAVGRPVAVNPSEELACIVRREEWPVLLWEVSEMRRRGGGELTQRPLRTLSSQRRGIEEKAVAASESAG